MTATKRIWKRFLDWATYHPFPIVLIITAVLMGVIGGGWLLGFGKGDDFTKNGKSPEAPGFIDGPGHTYGFHLLIDGRLIPCIVAESAVSCDWSVGK